MNDHTWTLRLGMRVGSTFPCLPLCHTIDNPQFLQRACEMTFVHCSALSIFGNLNKLVMVNAIKDLHAVKQLSLFIARIESLLKQDKYTMDPGGGSQVYLSKKKQNLHKSCIIND